MNEKCEKCVEIIDLEKKIQQLESKLEEKIASIHKDKVDIKEWYSLQTRFSELRAEIKEITNNAKEDRKKIEEIEKQIKILGEKIMEITILSNNVINKMDYMTKKQDELLELTKDVQVEQKEIRKLKEKNIFNQYEEWMNKSKIKKALGISFILLISSVFFFAGVFFFQNSSVFMDAIEKIVDIWSKIK